MKNNEHRLLLCPKTCLIELNSSLRNTSHQRHRTLEDSISLNSKELKSKQDIMHKINQLNSAARTLMGTNFYGSYTTGLEIQYPYLKKFILKDEEKDNHRTKSLLHDSTKRRLTRLDQTLENFSAQNIKFQERKSDLMTNPISLLRRSKSKSKLQRLDQILKRTFKSKLQRRYQQTIYSQNMKPSSKKVMKPFLRSKTISDVQMQRHKSMEITPW